MFKPLNIDMSEKSHSDKPVDVEKVKCLIIGSGPAGYTAEIGRAHV